MEPKKLSVIIVNFASDHYLKNCVDSLYDKLRDLLIWEIIVVNNDKNQDVSKLPLDFSKIKIIDKRENVGFGSGANLGAKEAQGEFLLILNPDAEIISKNINDVFAEFSKDEKIGIIGGKIVKNGVAQSWIAGKEISFLDLILNNLGVSRSKKIWNSLQKSECDFVAGTSLFIKKDLFDKLCGFDEKFFMYFEDMDLCRRAREIGKKVVFFPEFEIHHLGGKSYSDKNLQKKHYYDSMEYYLKKHGKLITRKVVQIIRKIFIKN